MDTGNSVLRFVDIIVEIYTNEFYILFLYVYSIRLIKYLYKMARKKKKFDEVWLELGGGKTVLEI